MARYYIKAKRKNTNEKWSEWTMVNDYPTAIHHVNHARELGYDSKLVPGREVKKLWDILGENETELTDKILDAGFCLRPVTDATNTIAGSKEKKRKKSKGETSEPNTERTDQ